MDGSCMPIPRLLLPRASVPLVAALATGACATLLDPGPPVLRIHTDTVVATVRDARGRTLGTTPFAARIRARSQQQLVIAAPGYDSAVVSIGRRPKEVLVTLINPLSLVVDGITGAVWTHDPGVVNVILTSTTRIPPTPADSLPDEVAAVVLDAFAAAAEKAGCEPLLVSAWRDAARVLANTESPAPPVPDSVRRMAREEVERAAPAIAEACTRPSPRVDRLAEIRRRLEQPPDPSAPENAAPLLAPVFFAPGEWALRDDSVRARLRALGSWLAEAPVTLMVEGFGAAGELRHAELGHQRALSVIRELQKGGLGADCCLSLSHSDAGDDAGGSADAAEARFNRRVTFTLGYARSP
jgi:outer membrane protein OmpA-like peptidoglycan-associated protein